MDKQPEYYEEEVELIDILQVIWRWKWFVFLSVGCVLSLVTAVITIKFPAQVGSRATLSLSFPGIEAGKNPDGSVFKEEQLLSPAIIRKASNQIQGVDKDQLLANWQGAVNVKPIIPKEMKDDDLFFPNKYDVVVFSTTPQGWAVFSQAGKTGEFVKAIINAYKERFEKEFIDTQLVAAPVSIKGLSPLDSIDVIEQQTDYLFSVINQLKSEKRQFRAPSLDKSLADVQIETQIFKNNVIPNVFTQTLDKSYKGTFSQQYMTLSRQIEKKRDEARAAKDMLDQLVQKGNNGAEGGGADREGIILLNSQAMEQYSRMDVRRYLVEKAFSADIAASQLKVDRDALAKDRENIMLNEPGQIPESILRLENKLMTLFRDANSIYAEYMQDRLDGTIRRVTEPEQISRRAVNLRLMVLMAVVASFFLSVFLAFFIEYLINARRKNDSEKINTSGR